MSEQAMLLSNCEAELEEESNREREQHTRRPLLIPSPLQTNDNEPRQYSRIIIRHGQQRTRCFRPTAAEKETTSSMFTSTGMQNSKTRPHQL